MTFVREIDPSRRGGSEPTARLAGAYEHRQAVAAGRLGAGSLACARCDAPVAVGPVPISVSSELTCPFCRYHGPVREFLSLASPTRPARVVLRVVPSAG